MLVTLEDFQNYTDVGKLGPRATLGVQGILAGLQSELEQYLNRPLEIGSFVESYRVLDEPISFVQISSDSPNNPLDLHRRTITLRNSPVVSVTSVYVSRSGSASVALTPITEFGVRRFGIDVWNPVVDDEYTVSYSAGLNGIDYPVLKLLILRAASREAQNMFDENKGIQEMEARSATVAITGFTEAELKSVKRLKRQRF